MVAKLLYYVVVHLDLVVATRKSFDVTSIYESLFQRKCCTNHFFIENAQMQLLIICQYMLHRKYIEKCLWNHVLSVYRPIVVLSALLFSAFKGHHADI